MDLRDLTIIIIKMFEGPFFFFIFLDTFFYSIFGGRVENWTLYSMHKKKKKKITRSHYPSVHYL